MKLRALHLGTYAGIPLKLHWTFSFVLIFVAFIGLKNERAISEIGVVFLYVFALFFCVILHEYGHALMAKRFKINTVDIILSPIGGLARLERLPNKAIHEFYVAIAGPMVNIIIAVFIGIILWLTSSSLLPDLNADVSELRSWSTFLSVVLAMNVVLFLFNLIPAFPMDGGRILRALLSIKLGRKKSTNISTYIGFAIASVFIIYGILNRHYTLSFIGVFVMIMARSERNSIIQEEYLVNNTSSDDRFSNKLRFNLTDQMYKLISSYYDGKGKNFMVFDDEGQLVGVVTENRIKEAIKEQQFKENVHSFMTEEITVFPERNLRSVLTLMKEFKIRYIITKDINGNLSLVDRYKIINGL